jgi:hypothetical protein
MPARNVPDGVVVVKNDRILDVRLPHGFAHDGDVFLEPELRRVDPDHEQSVVPIFIVECVDVKLYVLAVVEDVRPELDQHHLLA